MIGWLFILCFFLFWPIVRFNETGGRTHVSTTLISGLDGRALRHARVGVSRTGKTLEAKNALLQRRERSRKEEKIFFWKKNLP